MLVILMDVNLRTMFIYKLLDSDSILCEEMTGTTSIINTCRDSLAFAYQLFQWKRRHDKANNRHRCEILTFALLYTFRQETLEEVTQELVCLSVLSIFCRRFQFYVLEHQQHFTQNPCILLEKAFVVYTDERKVVV